MPMSCWAKEGLNTLLVLLLVLVVVQRGVALHLLGISS
jgi:hypothetical protein